MKEILIIHGGANKIRAKAAAILVAENIHRFLNIIFSGGKTAGTENPSEAENMKKIFLNRVKFIVPSIDTALLEGKILLEEKSCDTEDNAHQVGLIQGVSTNDTELTLLSSLSHLPRIQSIYSRLGFSHIDTISAERIFYDTGKKRYKDYVKKYLTSKPAIKAAVLEGPLYFLTQFEWGRKWIRSITQSRIEKNPPSE